MNKYPWKLEEATHFTCGKTCFATCTVIISRDTHESRGQVFGRDKHAGIRELLRYHARRDDRYPPNPIAIENNAVDHQDVYSDELG
jgi:hypothetical protein